MCALVLLWGKGQRNGGQQPSLLHSGASYLYHTHHFCQIYVDLGSVHMCVLSKSLESRVKVRAQGDLLTRCPRLEMKGGGL